jgi:AcrR family transcriptional regulator
LRYKEQTMTSQVKPSAREARRLQTRERILGAAIAEFTRSGMAGADVGAIVAAAGVAHGTFFFHFPSKEHVLLELECREEARLATDFARFLDGAHDLRAALTEVVHLVTYLERRFGPLLFKELLALHFSPTRPNKDEWTGQSWLKPPCAVWKSDDSQTFDKEDLKWTGSGRSFAMSRRGAAPV